MFDLLFALFASGGAVGFGAVLKGIFGGIQQAQDRKSDQIKLDGLRQIQNAEVAQKFLESQFGQTDNGKFAIHTRRMLALIGVSTMAVACFHCFALFDAEFTTLPSTARGGDTGPLFSLFWGLIEIPRLDKPISLTLGHVGLVIVSGFQIILGFYFGPGGRRT